MTSKRLDALAAKSIPNIAVVVIISSEEVATRDGEGDGGDTAEQLRVSVGHQLATSANIEQAASGIIRTSTEGSTRGEELDSVDIRRVAAEGLSASTRTNVPQLGSVIASTRNEEVLVGGDGDAHNVSSVLSEVAHLSSSLNIPEHADHITRRGDDLLLRQETAAGEVSSVGVQLTADADGRIATSEIVDRADVIETSASNQSRARRVGASHNP